MGAQEDIICIMSCFTFQPPAAEPSSHVTYWYQNFFHAYILIFHIIALFQHRLYRVDINHRTILYQFNTLL